MRNCHIWGKENPHAYIEKSTHPKRVTVWCGFWSRGIIGPLFFENEQGEFVTVNGDRYRAMLNEFLFPKMKRRILATFGFNWTALRATQPKLRLIFCALFYEDRTISRGADVARPPRRWDLTPLDYYL